MPLQPGSDRATIGKNITELEEHGSRPRSHRQILAIALSEAQKHPRADGGDTDPAAIPLQPPPAPQRSPIDLFRWLMPDSTMKRIDSAVTPPVKAPGDRAYRIARQAGGAMPEVPFFERQEAYSLGHQPYGLTVGGGGGRTDKNNVAVGAGSYVLPADVVSGLGEGNSLAGAKVFSSILQSMPWGITPPRSIASHHFPSPPHDPSLMDNQRPPISPTLADGGDPGDEAKQVPIQSADGEIILSPTDVFRVGQHYSSQRDLENYPESHKRIMRRGHRVLDGFVKEVRGRTIKHLKSLPGPVGSHEASKGHT